MSPMMMMVIDGGREMGRIDDDRNIDSFDVRVAQHLLLLRPRLEFICTTSEINCRFQIRIVVLVPLGPIVSDSICEDGTFSIETT